MSTDRDSAGRKQPSKYQRSKRAATAAKYRWKDKRVLIPGQVLPWHQRSFANELRHREGARKGGATTASRIKEQQRLFWNFYHGDSKDGLQGPFAAVVETFDRVEQAYVQGYGRNGPKWLAWDGFFASLLYLFVLAPAWTKQPEDIERDIWALYAQFMEADERALWGDGDEKGLLGPLLQYEEAQAERKRRIELWRDSQPNRPLRRA